MLIVHCSLKLAPEPASGRIKVIRNISAPLRLLVDCSSYQTASTAEAQGALRSWERRRPACCLKQHMQPEAGRLPSHHLIFFHTRSLFSRRSNISVTRPDASRTKYFSPRIVPVVK